MMNIKGLGPKKINLIWKELHIDSLTELEKACRENRIAEKKGFGAKTQQNILDSIHFQQQHAGKHLYAKVAPFAEAFTAKLKEHFDKEQFSLTGAFRRQLEIVDSLEWVTTASATKLKNFLLSEQIVLVAETEVLLIFTAENTLLLRFHLTNTSGFFTELVRTSSSEEFYSALTASAPIKENAASEEEIFASLGIPFIPPFLRDEPEIISRISSINVDSIVQTKDIKGLIHSHSNWSDGSNTIEEMANVLISLGFEYLVLSDHSKAAFYANGLNEQRIREQHRHIDELNALSWLPSVFSKASNAISSTMVPLTMRIKFSPASTS
jgi:DNA polymerase (family 10)